MKKIIYLAAGSLFFAITSCRKSNSTYDTAVRADISIEFDNVVGSANLMLNTATYTNALNQSFQVTKLKYYVSNFKLTNMDGTVYTVPQSESYFLIDESIPASQRIQLSIPEGEYKTLSFVIGVDSLRNTMDVSLRTGVLDVSEAASDMYWSWNSGYIFFKMEGISPVITSMGGVFQYHIGGFGGYSTPTSNNLKTVTLDLSARGTAKVKTGRRPNIHLFVDILKVLNGSTNIDFTATPMVHSIAPGVAIANNYASMVHHDHTEN
jgi:hypothetical protein